MVLWVVVVWLVVSAHLAEQEIDLVHDVFCQVSYSMVCGVCVCVCVCVCEHDVFCLMPIL